MRPGKPGTGNDHGGLRAYPTKKWRCDGCGKWMEGSLAYVAWDEVGKRCSRHRIIHGTAACDRSCSQKKMIGLERLVGADGLAMLLGWLDSGKHNTRSVIEVMRRIHIPRYELIAPWLSKRWKSSNLYPIGVHDPFRFKFHQEELERLITEQIQRGWIQPLKPGPYLRPGAQYAVPRFRKPISLIESTR